eukprot:794576-Amphidinium_carterae.1
MAHKGQESLQPEGPQRSWGNGAINKECALFRAIRLEVPTQLITLCVYASARMGWVNYARRHIAVFAMPHPLKRKRQNYGLARGARGDF